MLDFLRNNSQKRITISFFVSLTLLPCERNVYLYDFSLLRLFSYWCVRLICLFEFNVLWTHFHFTPFLWFYILLFIIWVLWFFIHVYSMPLYHVFADNIIIVFRPDDIFVTRIDIFCISFHIFFYEVTIQLHWTRYAFSFMRLYTVWVSLIQHFGAFLQRKCCTQTKCVLSSFIVLFRKHVFRKWRAIHHALQCSYKSQIVAAYLFIHDTLS